MLDLTFISFVCAAIACVYANPSGALSVALVSVPVQPNREENKENKNGTS